MAGFVPLLHRRRARAADLRWAKPTGIVVFLTRDRGKKRGVAKSARRSRKRFGGALEPLTEVAGGVLREREQRELVRLDLRRACVAARDGGALSRRRRRGADLRELLRGAARRVGARTPTPTSGCSGWARRCSMRCAAGVGAEPLARYFEYWLLRLQGVYPARRPQWARCRTGALSVPGALRAAVRAATQGVASAGASAAFSASSEPVHRRARCDAPGEGVEVATVVLSRHLDRASRATRVLRQS